MIILYLLLLQTSQNLSINRQAESPAAKYYLYVGEEGDLQLKVSIWGEIGSPGLYSITEDVDMATLISLAGGPTKNANLSNIKIMRSFPKPEVINVNMRNYFKTGDRVKIPFLKPGDMVKVDGTPWYKVQEVAKFITEATITIGVYYQLYNLLRNK
ncbi:MAG: SLBB domain-containing protein [bacterium]|nr:SLBB domain-containing protein [bacterium]